MQGVAPFITGTAANWNGSAVGKVAIFMDVYGIDGNTVVRSSKDVIGASSTVGMERIVDVDVGVRVGDNRDIIDAGTTAGNTLDVDVVDVGSPTGNIRDAIGIGSNIVRAGGTVDRAVCGAIMHLAGVYGVVRVEVPGSRAGTRQVVHGAAVNPDVRMDITIVVSASVGVGAMAGQRDG